MNDLRAAFESFRAAVDPLPAAMLVDLWGVVHDGVRLYPEAASTLAAVARAEISIYFVTNASYREARLRAQLDDLHIPSQWYRALISAGEIARSWIAEHLRGARYFHYGRRENANLLAGLANKSTRGIEEADFILLTDATRSFGDGRELPQRDLLQRAHDLGLPMLCTNPDLKITTQDGETLPCAGRIAAAYHDLGGTVIHFGKPYELIYRHARRRAGRETALLCVGDTLHTDLIGARDAGLPAVWIDRENTSPDRRARRLEAAQLAPLAVLDRFIWSDVEYRRSLKP